jgi:hypothetical protein
MEMEPYRFVRFRWWIGADLTTLAQELGEKFNIEEIIMLRDEMAVYLKDEREEIMVEADTLKARLSSFRAVLYQSDVALFTEKDLELRKRIFEIYSRSRPTPFPWFFSQEPKFETK